MANEIRKPIKIDYPEFEIEKSIDSEYKKDLDKITFDNVTTSNTSRTLRNIRKNVTAKIKSEFGITDKEELNKKVDIILKTQGLHEANFDFMSNFENGLQEKLNDVSIDDNANKGTERSYKAYITDLTKPVFKLIGHDTLYRVMKDLYGRKEAKRLSANMYDYSLGISDSTGIGCVYCWALDTTKLVTIGRDFGTLKSSPAHRVSSYISAVCETVHQISNHLMGACALATIFLDVTHLMVYKQRITLDELRRNSRGVRKVLENEFQQFVHSINFNSRTGGTESPFTNVSIFDKVKLRAMLGDDNYGWYFPNKKIVSTDLDKDDKISDEEFKDYIVDYISEVQKVFIDFFDKGDPLANGANYKFPVVTYNLSKDENGQILDKDSLASLCKKDISKYNIFCSLGTKIASCCLSGDEIIKVRFDKFSGNESTLLDYKLSDFVEMYNTDHLLNFECDLKNAFINSYNFEKRLFENSEIIRVLKRPNDTGKLITFTTELGNSIRVTPNHKMFVKNSSSGEIEELPAYKLLDNIQNWLLPIECTDSTLDWHVIIDYKVDASSEPVYCIELDKNHNFAANSIITHNCRMINSKEMMDSFAAQVNSLGGGGTASMGSHRVVTINFQRIALEATSMEDYYNILKQRIDDAAKILKAHKLLIFKLKDAGLQSFINNGYINPGRLFSTFGILGTYEAQRTLRQKFGIAEDVDLVKDILTYFNAETLEAGKRYNIVINQEQIPAESMAVRFATADKALFNLGDDYYKLYANQHVPLWEDKTIFERLAIAGKYDQLLTGGSIVHLNVDGDTTYQQNLKLIEHAVKCGTEHFAINKCYTICNDCGEVMKHKTDKCEKCGSTSLDYILRIIGYFVRVSAFGKVRREWEFPRRVFTKSENVDAK